MSDSSDPVFDSELLDLHLGLLGDTQRDALRARIAANPKLTEQDAALAAVFRALQSDPVEPAPPELATRICARVAAAGPPPRVVPSPRELTWDADQSAVTVIRLGNLREIVAVAAMIVLMVGVAVPSLLHMRERSERMSCSRNLALVGQGLQQYASTFNASLPFAGWGARKSWQPTTDPGIETLPNRRHIYPLLRYAYVTDPRVFVCPTPGDVPMPADQIANRNDFIESRNLSYAYFNMAGVRPSVSDNPNLPIMADDNPLFDDGVQLFERLGLSSPAQGNSRAHHGSGQNILTLDGHVKWVTTPNCGIGGDNIWLLNGVETYTGREGPQSPTDAHLLK
ncbi:MAG: hypothetical protein ABIG44_16645 [Planctomycetota bacterium]